MTNADQLNFIRYSMISLKKRNYSLSLSSELEGIIKIIETNIKIGWYNSFQNSHNGGGHKNTNYSLKSTSYNSYMTNIKEALQRAGELQN